MSRLGRCLIWYLSGRIPFIHPNLPTAMAKGKSVQKEKKKEPVKSAKEKKAEKIEKKAVKNRSSE